MPICSKNLSLCCTVISVWAVIQLTVMGYLFYNHAVAFVEDIELGVENEKDPVSWSAFFKMAEQKYSFTANNCWVAAGIYVVVFLISLQQFFANK